MSSSTRSGAPATLELDGLDTHFATSVSFSVAPGRVLGLVGESGSGKSVTGFSIMRLIDLPGRIVGGRILFQGRDLARLPEEEMRQLRGNRIAMVFQDPMMTLNPVLRIGTQMLETVQAHEAMGKGEAWRLCRDTLGRVGIPSPEERLAAFPHQFSGGMRQRVAIAIAMLLKPDLIIADEPTTALDVSIQAQILAEMQELVRETGTALIWITHDLSVVYGLADEIAVMYAGRIVEAGPIESVFTSPIHPYTSGLLASIPRRNKRGALLHQIPGMAPNLAALPAGCAFRARCERTDAACLHEPQLSVLAKSRSFRCFHPVLQEESCRD
jgi:peptide/nickel transport system ATP-binding protein